MPLVPSLRTSREDARDSDTVTCQCVPVMHSEPESSSNVIFKLKFNFLKIRSLSSN